jgi:hypothetical protein
MLILVCMKRCYVIVILGLSQFAFAHDCTKNTKDPSVTICTPADKSTVPSPVHVSSLTTSSKPVVKVHVSVDGIKKQEQLGDTFHGDVPMDEGERRVTVVAKDNTGFSFWRTIYITVSGSTPPPPPPPDDDGGGFKIPYSSPITVTQMVHEDPASWHFVTTHIAVEGHVIHYQHSDAADTDGDTHVILCDDPTLPKPSNADEVNRDHCIVGEWTPYLECERFSELPKYTTIYGISRYDAEHKWWEVHPIEKISGVECSVAGTPTGTR